MTVIVTVFEDDPGKVEEGDGEDKVTQPVEGSGEAGGDGSGPNGEDLAVDGPRQGSHSYHNKNINVLLYYDHSLVRVCFSNIVTY